MELRKNEITGIAYAVIDSNGVLHFVRSTKIYDNDSTGTVEAIDGNNYSGSVYTGFEDEAALRKHGFPWRNFIQIAALVKDPPTYNSIQKTNDPSLMAIAKRFIAPWHSIAEKITAVKSYSDMFIQPISTAYWFEGFRNVTFIDLRGVDTSKVKTMNVMFKDCSSLTVLNLSNMDTSSVIDMYGMFDGCSSIKELDLSGFNTENVTDMAYIFRNCSSLTSLCLDRLDTKKVINMNGMFNGCRTLANLNLRGFDTRKVEYMINMFCDCSSLATLNLESFITGNVEYMDGMFYDCHSLTYLDLRSFDTRKVVSMSGMFGNCFSLTCLNLSSFNLRSISDMYGMFDGCNSLREVTFGENFWFCGWEDCLPEGVWYNTKLDIKATETELNRFGRKLEGTWIRIEQEM